MFYRAIYIKQGTVRTTEGCKITRFMNVKKEFLNILVMAFAL